MRVTLPAIVALALALSADAVSVGAALGLRYRRPRQIFRLSFHFGLFQALMPLMGALMGRFMLRHVERWDHWIAFALLALLGVRMIRTGVHGSERRGDSIDLTRGFSLIGLSVAVSIDALAAGITLPALGAPIAFSVALIGIVTAVATCVAILLARFVTNWFGARLEIVAGLVLIGLGMNIVFEHIG
jgi:putative Mn2+ efflux pump MntP